MKRMWILLGLIPCLAVLALLMRPDLISTTIEQTNPIVTDSEWSPPENPEPKEILGEAQKDSRDGRYADALTKHLWFHEHTLEHAPAMSGVRRSFALSDWKNLADAYPPAMDALLAIHDQTKEKVVTDGPDRIEAFADLESLNNILGQDQETIEVFEQLNKSDPEIASRAFHYAKSLLVAEQRIDLLAQFLNPEFELRALKTTHDSNQSYLESRQNSKDRSRISSTFLKLESNRAAVLVAVLVATGRVEEANVTAEWLREISDDPAYFEAIATALDGKFPEPFPPRRG